jgi:hypothetical protein
MKPKTFSAIGGWQSLMFCVGMYCVALFFSIFICSSVFYAFNTKTTSGKANNIAKTQSISVNKKVLAAVTP